MNSRPEDRTIRARVTVVVDLPDDGTPLASVGSAVARSVRSGSEPAGARVVSVDVIEVPKPMNDAWIVQPVDQYGRTFWESPSLRQLATEQGVGPIRDARELAGGFWPEDEGPDEFVDWLREQRRRG